MPVVFDANILIDLFNPRVKGDRRAKLDGLVAQHGKSKILIPTPSLTEYLIRAGKARDEVMARLGSSRHFVIEPFDQRAATECALLLEQHWDSKARGTISRTKFKFDWQIMAIALSRNASVIYSDDGDLQRIATGLPIKVVSVEELPIPDTARQHKMFGDKP